MSDKSPFVWYELATTDPVAAKTFYTDVVGWAAQDVDMGAMTYTLLTAGETQVGGLMMIAEQAKAMGAPPHWLGYIQAADVDAAAEQVKSLGGAVYMPPMDIPNVGRFAVVADPQSAVVALFKWAHSGGGDPAAPGTPGHVGWRELHTTDWEKAFGFYGEMFAWSKAQAMDMGEIGTYQIFVTDGEQPGAMFNSPAVNPRPFWLYYFNVGDIDAACERVKGGGGKILNGPNQVPGGAWVIQGSDPQGAMFGLVGTRPS